MGAGRRGPGVVRLPLSRVRNRRTVSFWVPGIAEPLLKSQNPFFVVDVSSLVPVRFVCQAASPMASLHI